MPWSRDKVELFSESASEFSAWSDDLDERGEISSGRTRRPWANCDPTPPKNGMLARRPAMVVVGPNEGPARGNLGEPATGVSGGELGVPIEVLMTGACDCLIVVVFGEGWPRSRGLIVGLLFVGREIAGREYGVWYCGMYVAQNGP